VAGWKSRLYRDCAPDRPLASQYARPEARRRHRGSAEAPFHGPLGSRAIRGRAHGHLQMGNPHICPPHGIGRQVTEYLDLEGETLADRLKTGPLPADYPDRLFVVVHR